LAFPVLGAISHQSGNNIVQKNESSNLSSHPRRRPEVYLKEEEGGVLVVLAEKVQI